MTPSGPRRATAIGDDRRQHTRPPGAAEDMEQHSGTADATTSGQPSQPGPGAAAEPGSTAGPASNQTITLTVNGEARACPAGLKLPQLLEALGYKPQLVVVEFNGEILPRQRWSEQSVGESDVLEVVTIVGGGS